VPTGFPVEGRGPGSKRHFFQKICPITVEARLEFKTIFAYFGVNDNHEVNMSISVTVPVPSSVYRLAQKTSQAVSRSVEQILADVIAASPFTEDLPPALQTELDNLAQMSDDELWKIARSVFPTGQRRKYDRLLEKNSAGKLTPTAREQLQALRLESERLMLRKAHAYWRLNMRSIFLGCLLAVFVAACASTNGTNTPRRSSNVITAEELAASSAKEALEAIELLRPQWLRTRGVASPASLQALVPAVYLNNQRLPELGNLRNFPAANIEEIRYLNSQDATTLYGTGNAAGAIVVKTK
jgi:hypothetical protein